MSLADKTVEDYLKESEHHWNDADWLSRACLELASINYYMGTEVAKAEEAEKKFFIEAAEAETNKKLSIEDRKALAITFSGNRYGILKMNHEDTMEIINAIKTRLRILEWEKQSSKGQ
jgi:beta-glucosidase/6-phospho-beta-glucosidase/beta-galactosidase